MPSFIYNNTNTVEFLSNAAAHKIRELYRNIQESSDAVASIKKLDRMTRLNVFTQAHSGIPFNATVELEVQDIFDLFDSV